MLSISSLCADSNVSDDVKHFRHLPKTQVIFGINATAQIGEIVAIWGCRHALVVTDPGIRQAGHADLVADSLQSAGIAVTWYDQVRENPDTTDVARCLAVAQDAGIDVIVGVGGGSSMDTAKGCNFLLTNGGAMQDYWGTNKAAKPMLPFVAVPTTAGTGSECQSYALIADETTHVKMACGDKKAAARLAVLDPVLTLTQPAAVTALTGTDALSHAVESFVCNVRTPVSADYARLAFHLLERSFSSVLNEPAGPQLEETGKVPLLDFRARMQLGAAYAGTAIENSMLGAAHACANPLTAAFGIVHGQAVGVMLPHVVRFNAELSAAAVLYEELYQDDLPARLTELLSEASLAIRLRDLNIPADTIPNLAEAAAKQWTGHFNPRSLGLEDFRCLYENAW